MKGINGREETKNFFKTTPALDLGRNHLILHLILVTSEICLCQEEEEVWEESGYYSKILIYFSFPATLIPDHSPRTFPAAEALSSLICQLHLSQVQLSYDTSIS